MFTHMRQYIFAAIAAVLPLAPVWGADQAGFRLLMVEQAGCAYCRMFNRDIAPIYHKSAEGAVAPLVHVDLRGPLPDGVTLVSRPYVTPTFILLDPDGVEVERLTGYPGDEFFWPYIANMLVQAGALPAQVN
jgi:hypothetical protein